MDRPKPVIVYCSQTGFTKRYADWLAEEYGCRAIPFKERKAADIENASVVIFCSWFHAGGLKVIIAGRLPQRSTLSCHTVPRRAATC